MDNNNKYIYANMIQNYVLSRQILRKYLKYYACGVQILIFEYIIN